MTIYVFACLFFMFFACFFLLLTEIFFNLYIYIIITLSKLHSDKNYVIVIV